ncbi:hypothetical protein TPAR_05170 [Tolypocladium paradoxum]|uniref:Uncharacterized protein n=1 Tax=Tolypocladium paradoxum TaxID=94208 RepID=A0A2S4KWS4_9HYPO|nr:hypothetical protein TPAR_05170 [Tolypocladium paradoxum]
MANACDDGMGPPRPAALWCASCASTLARGTLAGAERHRCVDDITGRRDDGSCAYCVSKGLECRSVWALAHGPNLGHSFMGLIAWALVRDTANHPMDKERLDHAFENAQYEVNKGLDCNLDDMDDLEIEALRYAWRTESDLAELNRERVEARDALRALLGTANRQYFEQEHHRSIGPNGRWRAADNKPDGYDTDDSRLTWDSEGGEGRLRDEVRMELMGGARG